jgi:hypothetical protein
MPHIPETIFPTRERPEHVNNVLWQILVTEGNTRCWILYVDETNPHNIMRWCYQRIPTFTRRGWRILSISLATGPTDKQGQIPADFPYRCYYYL